MNVADARFCDSCGKPMDATEAAPQSNLDVQERRRVNRELGRAYSALKNVRLVFVAFAALAALGLLLVWLAYDERVSGANTMLLVSAVTFVFCVLGAIFLKRAPFLWALALACLLTVQIVLTLALGSFPGVVDILLAIGAWGATARLTNVSKLLRENPDVVGAQRILGTRRRAGPSDASEQLRERSRDRRQKTLVFAGVVAVGAVLVITLVKLSGSSKSGRNNEAQAKALPESPDYKPYVEKFKAAWKAGDRNGIVALFDPDVHEYQLGRLEKRLAIHEIKTEFPELKAYNEILIPRNNPQKVKAYWSIPTSRLRTEWHHESGKWVLVKLSFGRPK